MPRKAKEKIDELDEKATKTTKSTTKKTSTTAKTTTKKTATKTSQNKNETEKPNVPKTKASSKAKENTKTSKSTKTTTKASNSKSKTTRKATTKHAVSTKSTKKTKVTPTIVTEYYDLPFRYNQTIVKVLAQTPKTLFIYWDISDDDRNAYSKKYGADFFEKTRPYLMITNETMNYTFEVEINDFANSWYLHIQNANCQYKVELGRKFVVNSEPSSFEPYHINDYIYVTSSNQIETPNDHVLFDKLSEYVFFKNAKTNIVEKKHISSIAFLKKVGKVYNIYDLYKEIYHDELISDGAKFPLTNSSSSPTFKSN